MSKCHIMSNLYYNMSSYPCFKEVHGWHYNSFRSSINRSHYRIFDLELWFKSDFKEGEKLIVERISEKGKYFFPKHHMKCFL